MMKRPYRLLAGLLAASCAGQVSDNSEPTGAAPTAGAPTAGSSTGGTAPTTPGGPATATTPGATTGTAATPPPAPAPYEPIAARAYASKVKDVLTGLPLGDDELGAVAKDPKALRGLIDKWMGTPEFRTKMFEFFKAAFQQTQLDPSDLDDQLKLSSAGVNGTDQRRMLKAVEEMFARTVLQLIDEGRPFTDALTTNRFMVNPPLMVALSYMDAAPMDDLGRAVGAGYWILDKFGRTTFKLQLTTNTDPATGISTPIPLEETLNPAHPNFMKWYFRQPNQDPMKGTVYKFCNDPITATGTGAISGVFRAMFGSRQQCQGAQSEPTLFSAEDWNNWKMVTIRPPKQGEERALFWDLPRFRDPATTELVLNTPRVGFMTTIAFFANWPTNPSNSYRVTLNQALIVALGRSFDDRNTVAQVSETSVDAQHVQPGTACFGCHQTLDPMRDFYKQTYSMFYFQQLSMLTPRAPQPPTEAVFTVDGSAPVRGSGILTLAKAMADHPSFAPAWVQKFCQIANATPCNEEDPEFKRVASVFKQSRHDFKVLIRELFSSPLVTYVSRTKTAELEGVVMSIARRETLCSRLSNRLGAKDVCNMLGESGLPRIATQVKNLSLGVPGSSYSRADEHPMIPHDPNLFFISGTEKICIAIAGQLVGTNATPPVRWTVANKDAAIGEFVTLVMGVPAVDPLAGQLTDILGRHYTGAIAAKETPADALRSTFTLACSSPLGVSLGL